MLPRRLILAAAAALAFVGLGCSNTPAHAQNPITIGFGMALTGGLAPNGKAALLAMQIWEDDINAKGGLLGRPVKLVYYDDQTNPANDARHLHQAARRRQGRPDRVSGYATNMIAPAMPIIMQHNRTFLSLFGLAVNSEFHYPKYFSMHADRRPEAEAELRRTASSTVAMAQNPKPQTLAMVGADAEFPHNAMDGAREHRQGSRAEDRLRQDLSADHDRLHADRARDPGDQSRYRARLLLSARHRRHDPRRQRGRAEDASCSAAAWSGCRAPRSRRSLARC